MTPVGYTSGHLSIFFTAYSSWSLAASSTLSLLHTLCPPGPGCCFHTPHTFSWLLSPSSTNVFLAAVSMPHPFHPGSCVVTPAPSHCCLCLLDPPFPGCFSILYLLLPAISLLHQCPLAAVSFLHLLHLLLDGVSFGLMVDSLSVESNLMLSISKDVSGWSSLLRSRVGAPAGGGLGTWITETLRLCLILSCVSAVLCI